jgi:hypothetical protein
VVSPTLAPPYVSLSQNFIPPQSNPLTTYPPSRILPNNYPIPLTSLCHRTPLPLVARHIPHMCYPINTLPTLFTITPKSINQMLQIPKNNPTIIFSIKSLNDLYQNLSYPQRSHIFNIFLPEDAQFPKKNPPYPSSIFSFRSNQIISILCYLLGYFSYEWVDEPILVFLSIFSTEERATIQFDFSRFMANNKQDQFFRFSTEGMLRYSLVLVYLFLFFVVRQFSMCFLEIRSGRKSTDNDLMDLTSEEKFN